MSLQKRLSTFTAALLILALSAGCGDADDGSTDGLTDLLESIGTFFVGTSGKSVPIKEADTTPPVFAVVVDRLASGERQGELSQHNAAVKFRVNRDDAVWLTAVGIDTEGLKRIELIGHGVLLCADTPTTVLYSGVTLASFEDAGVVGGQAFQTRYTSNFISRSTIIELPERKECHVRASICARATNFGNQQLESGSFIIDFGRNQEYWSNTYATCTGSGLHQPPLDYTPSYGGQRTRTTSPAEQTSERPPVEQFEFCLTGPGGQISLIWNAISEEEARKDIASKYGGYAIASGRCQ